MRNFIARRRWVIGFIAMLAVFAYLIVETRNTSSESAKVSRDNIALTKKVQSQANALKSQQIESRETSYEGCLRTNERTSDTNNKFANIYQIFQTAAEGNPKLKIQLQDKEDEFAQLTKTPCETAYPPLPGTPPRKK